MRSLASIMMSMVIATLPACAIGGLWTGSSATTFDGHHRWGVQLGVSSVEPRHSASYLGLDASFSSPRGTEVVGLRNGVVKAGFRWCCDAFDPEIGVAVGLGEPTSYAKGLAGSGLFVGVDASLPVVKLTDVDERRGFSPMGVVPALYLFTRVGVWTAGAQSDKIEHRQFGEITIGIGIRVTAISDVWGRNWKLWTP